MIYIVPNVIVSFNQYTITLQINMIWENISQKFRLKNIDETRNYCIGEVNENDLICKKYKRVGTTYTDYKNTCLF